MEVSIRHIPSRLKHVGNVEIHTPNVVHIDIVVPVKQNSHYRLRQHNGHKAKLLDIEVSSMQGRLIPSFQDTLMCSLSDPVL